MRESSTIKPDRETITKLLDEGSEVLGFQPFDYQFSISHLPDKYSGKANAMYDSQRLEFMIPDKLQESTMFHECIHYLTWENGVKLPSKTFYRILLDETIAEQATAEVYGFSHDSKVNVLLWKNYIEFNNIVIDPFSKLYKKFISRDEVSVDIYMRHRALEKEVIKHSSIDTAAELIKEFNEYLPVEEHALREAAKSLCMENAMALIESGFKTKDLINHINGCNADPYGILCYFNMIANCSEHLF